MAADRAAALGLPTLPDDPEAEAAFERAHPDRRTGRRFAGRTLDELVALRVEEPVSVLAVGELVGVEEDDP